MHKLLFIFSVSRDAVSVDAEGNKCSFTTEKPGGQTIIPDSKYDFN